MSEKFCKDCKHVDVRSANTPDAFWRCGRPISVNMVTGESKPLGAYCDWQREAKNFLWSREFCGKTGIYWEPKP